MKLWQQFTGATWQFNMHSSELNILWKSKVNELNTIWQGGHIQSKIWGRVPVTIFNKIPPAGKGDMVKIVQIGLSHLLSRANKANNVNTNPWHKLHRFYLIFSAYFIKTWLSKNRIEYGFALRCRCYFYRLKQCYTMKWLWSRWIATEIND